MPTPLIDRTGHTYGEWTVLSRAEPFRRNGCFYWTCRCSCGAVVDVRGKNLATERSVQCVRCGGKKKKTNVYVRWGQRNMHLSDWAQALGINVATLWHRVDRGWPLRDALSVGVDPVILDLLVPDRSEDPVRSLRKKDLPSDPPQPQGKQ